MNRLNINTHKIQYCLFRYNRRNNAMLSETWGDVNIEDLEAFDVLIIKIEIA